jgi:fatty-acyl-CoA synthase
LLAPIKDDNPATAFKGYTDPKATAKKILNDVFVKGDKYFRSGDLISMDSAGYFYFVDRIGDTFRWKGENVSTMEVSEAVSSYPQITEANVYGVQIPGKDGRACMAAVVAEGEIDPNAFATYIKKNLPLYSVPMFIRFQPGGTEITGTFKHKKVDLRDEGMDVTKVQDPMWWYNSATST